MPFFVLINTELTYYTLSRGEKVTHIYVYALTGNVVV